MTSQETIESFSELKSGWDSYGASAIDPAQMRLALRFIDALSQVQPVPTNSGGVGFEFVFGGMTMMVETVSKHVMSGSLFRDNDDPDQKELYEFTLTRRPLQ